MVRVGGEVTGRPGEGGLEAGGEGGRLVSQLVAGMRGQVVRVKGRVVVWRERRGGRLETNLQGKKAPRHHMVSIPKLSTTEPRERNIPLRLTELL